MKDEERICKPFWTKNPKDKNFKNSSAELSFDFRMISIHKCLMSSFQNYSH